jgi:hypothetical protein
LCCAAAGWDGHEAPAGSDGHGIVARMPTLPDTVTLLVRTDFADDDAWDQVRDEATREYGPDGFRAYIEPVSDPRWANAPWLAVKAAAPTGEAGPSVLFIADSTTFASPEHLVLVVDLQDKFLPVAEFPEIADRMPFRCTPSALWDVENNLNIANLDWEDYAGMAADDGGVYRGFEFPPPPTPEERAEAERQAELRENRRREQERLAAELRYWGGTLPSDPIRATGGNARAMAKLDVGLADAIAAASPDTQRAIARWAARRAYEVAGIADLEWVAPALRSLDQGRELPSPFDNRQQVWPKLSADPRVPRRTVVSLDGRIPNMRQQAMAIPALFDAARADPLDAALAALYAAVVTFGRDDYPALLGEVRATFGL